MSDEIHSAIGGAMQAYAALLQFDALVPGQERALLYGAAKSSLRDRQNERLAWEIADLLPLALARPELVAKGVKLDEHYGRVDSQGRLREYRLLKDAPVYCAAVALVPELQTQDPRTAAAIAKLSVEYQMITAALTRGSKPGDLEPGPPILSGPDELCPPLDQRPQLSPEPFWLRELHRLQRPWWKFW